MPLSERQLERNRAGGRAAWQAQVDRLGGDPEAVRAHFSALGKSEADLFGEGVQAK